MFRIALFVSCISIACCGWCSEADDKISVGELPNGLTYYIRENNYPPERASLRLVVKVGSVHEAEDERGVAHFIEHLNFRGSSHFADGEIIRYLESIGAGFGPDANAETSLASTTYILEVPLDQERALDQALLALRDFAGNALLADEIIEKERNVVLDEMHQTLSSADYRLQEKSFQTFLPDSPLARSLPIGTQEVISRVEPEALRAFYKKWYRSDRMAVVAVGDFDAKEVLARIERLFSDILPSEDLPPEPLLGEISEEDPKILIHFDPDLPFTRIVLSAFFPTPERKGDPKEALKEEILSYLAHTYFQNRIAELEESGLSLGALAYEGEFLLPGLSACQALSVLLGDSVEDGMREFQQLLASIGNEGMASEDLELARDSILEEIRGQQLNLEYTPHHEYAETCIDHFLEQKPLLSLEWEMLEGEGIACDLTLDECNDYLAKLHIGKSAHVLFATSDPELYESISEDDLAEVFLSEPSVNSREASGKRHSFSYLEPTGEGILAEVQTQGPVSQWTLGNRMDVFLKATDLEHDRVTLVLQSDKGLAHVSESDFDSAAMLADYLWDSGLNGLNASEFESYLDSLGMRCSLSISLNQSALEISTPKDHLETAFQIVHDLFYPLSFDRSKWPLLVGQMKEVQKQMKNIPFGAFYFDSIKINTQDNYLFRQVDLSAIDPEKTESLAPFFFGTPQDFTTILVGDFDEKEVERLVKRYLASLPELEKEAVSRPQVSCLFPMETIEKDFACGNQTYERVMITVPFEMEGPFSHVRAACKLMTQRLIEKLRWQAGGTYGVSVQTIRPFSPFYDNATVQISFTCQQGVRASLIQTVFEEIEKGMTELATNEEIGTLQELLLKENQTESLSNDYWIARISNRIQQGLALDSIGNDEMEIRRIDAAKIRDVMEALFVSPYHSVLTHVPGCNK